MKQEIILSGRQIKKSETVADTNHIESFVKRHFIYRMVFVN